MNSTWMRFTLVAVLILLDQATKLLAVSELPHGIPQPVWPWLNWTLLYNPGAAFSMFASADGWQRYLLSAVSIVVSTGVAVWLFRLPTTDRLQGASLGLILAGAIGNLIDRLRLGEVVDFIQVHYAGWYFPAFNIADSAITCGVIGMLWLEISLMRAERKNRA
ncbi:MAG: lipoprotein signal peptidase [Immundisolibacteraceae bacterium]|nr:lipoprotein signal peptidase [Immundisolibacteraceae bacterium]